MSINVAVLQHGQPNSAAPRKQTSFLGLPIELRNAIYEYLIPNGTVYGPWFGNNVGGPPDRRPVRLDEQPCCPAILRVNRQIHDEVIGMFYGTAQFWAEVNGSTCHIFGQKFSTQHQGDATPNKLPPSLRFIRSLNICIYISWPWNMGEQPDLDSPLPGLPLLPHGTTLIAECLSRGPYELRQIKVHEVTNSHARMPTVINCTLEDRGRLFRAVLTRYLTPLRMLRGVDLKLDGLCKIGHLGTRHWDTDIVRNSLRSKEEVVIALRRLHRIRMHLLQKLAEEVSQHA